MLVVQAVTSPMLAYIAKQKVMLSISNEEGTVSMLDQEREETVAANQRPGEPLFHAAALDHLQEERQRWEETVVEPAQKRLPEREHLMTTSSVPIQRVYAPQDNAQLDYQRDLGLPGEYPYTRGVQPTMYRAKPWTMRMFAGFGTAEDTNARFKYLLAQGQTGLSTAFDMPTLYGYDTDHPMALASLANVAWPSLRWPTWRSCSPTCRWTRSRPP